MAQSTSMFGLHPSFWLAQVGISASITVWSVLRESRYAFQLPWQLWVVFVEAYDHICLKSLQEHSKRFTDVIWCPCPSDFCPIRTFRAADLIWSATRHFSCNSSCFRRWNQPTVASRANETRRSTKRWFDPLDDKRTVPGWQIRSAQRNQNREDCYSPSSSRKRLRHKSFAIVKWVLQRTSIRCRCCSANSGGRPIQDLKAVT